MSAPMLSRVYIDNYRTFVNFEWKPQSVNLMLGDNGAGKTSFFDVVKAIREVASVEAAMVKDGFPGSTKTRWDHRTTQTFELDIKRSEETFTYRLVLEHDEQARIHHEIVTSAQQTLFEYVGHEVHLHNDAGCSAAPFRFSDRESFLPRVESRQDNTALMRFRRALNEVQLYHPDPVGMSGTSETEAPVLDDSARNFASWYRGAVARSPEFVGEFLADIKRCMPGFRTLKIVESGRAKVLVVDFEMGPEPYQVDFSELSDGQRILIANYALARLAPQSSALMIDEADNFVAFSEIQPWLRLLRETFDSGTQVFLITHHSEAIDYFAADGATLFERTVGGPTRLRVVDVGAKRH